jgi:hypothetical protein
MGEIFAVGDLRAVEDITSADWIVAGVREFGSGVGSLLPVTFEAYARALHPASRRVEGEDVDVQWSEVASANRRVAHAAMEWVAITGDWRFMTEGGQPGAWDDPPSIGSLPARQATSLAGVLSRFTQTPSDCWYAVWDGYGNAPYARGTVALIHMPQRPMVLLRGPLGAAGTAFSSMGWPESASLWWPDDRSWYVATDIDLMSTYVGGSAQCIEAVLADERLEAFAVSVDQTVHWKSDTVNPTPEPPPAPQPVSDAVRRRVLESLRTGPRGLSTVTSRAPRPTPPGDTPGR